MRKNVTIDLHIHTNASDGTDTPSELLGHIKECGITSFAITDHDTIDASMYLKNYLTANPNPSLVFHTGIEFSACFRKCETDEHLCKVHILGYDYDAESPLFREILEEGKQKRRMKLQVRLNHLSERGLQLPEERITWLYEQVNAGKSIGKPHLANELIRAELVPEEERTINQVIPKYLSGIRIPNERVDALQAIRAVQASGGHAVWAHPLGGEGEPRISFDECEQQLRVLCSAGLEGLECHYSRYTRDECLKLTKLANDYHLSISGGSDYHGTNKNIALGTLNADGIAVKEEEITLFQ